MEVLELTSTLGIHATNIGVPLLMEVLTEEGKRDGPAPLSARQQQLKAEFAASRGYWHEFWDGLLELDPELHEARANLAVFLERTGRDAEAAEQLAFLDGVELDDDVQQLVDFVRSNLEAGGGSTTTSTAPG